MLHFLGTVSAVALALAATATCPAYGGIITCPYPAFASLDGCAGSGRPLVYKGVNALSYQDPNLLTPGHIFQSGQTVAPNLHRTGIVSLINWNVAGADFAVGVTQGPGMNGAYCDGAFIATDNPKKPCSHDAAGNLTPLIDPSLYDWAKDGQAGYANVGCTAAANYGSPYQRAVKCVANQSTMNVEGFDWAPAKSTDGGRTWHQTCVGLDLEDTGSVTNGTVNFVNNRVDWGGDASCQWLKTNGSPSLGVMTPIYINVSPLHGWVVNVLHNHVSQEMQAAYNTSGRPMWIGTPAPIHATGIVTKGTASFSSVVTLNIRWNVLENIESKGIVWEYACGGIDWSYNVMHNIGMFSNGEHAEFNYSIPHWSPDGVTGKAVQDIHCPGYVQASAQPIASWAGSSWGQMDHFTEINNTAWNDNGNEGISTSFFDNALGFSAPELLNVQTGRIALNSMVANFTSDDGTAATRVWFWLQNGGSASNAGQVAGYAPTVGDVLAFNTPECRAGATSHTRPPTVVLRTTTLAAWGDPGNCGYSTPKSGTYHLLCLRCQDGHASGFDTGWTISNTPWQNYNISALFNSASDGDNLGTASLNGDFLNYVSYSIDHNMLDATGIFGRIPGPPFTTYNGPSRYWGAYQSCSGGASPTLPSGLGPNFWPYTGNATQGLTTNFQPNGTVPTYMAFVPKNGC